MLVVDDVNTRNNADARNVKQMKAKRKGRRSIDETNRIRASLGLAVVPKAKRESRAILPMEKQNRNRQILATMLSKKGQAIVQKIMDKALTEGDPDQLACLKMCVDRMIPVSFFEKEKQMGRGGINIQIMGVDAKIEKEEDVIEGEMVE